MRCSSLSVANGLKLIAIQKYLKRKKCQFTNYSDAIYRRISQNKHAYFFANGTIVCWNLSRREINAVLAQTKRFRIQAYRSVDQDEFSYRITGKTNIQPHRYFNVDIITLSEDENDLRVSLTYALSQSIKLKSYENHLESLIKQHTGLIKDLASKGKIKLSRKRILKVMGLIFIAKDQINLKSEYYNPPKFFWQHAAYNNDYLLIENYLDIPKRVAALNQKLDTLNEMFTMLNSQLQHQHSSVLEIVIILLIAIEILFSILSLFHHA